MMVTIAPPQERRAIPLVVNTTAGESDAAGWAAGQRTWIEEQLVEHGALLFRGFEVTTPEDFNRFVTAVSGDPLEYKERSSPRSQVTGNIYTSTDYPANYSIFLHNENSYASSWPLKLFFCCELPAGEGGETPIASNRRISERIDAGVRERFESLGVMYVRNFGQGLGLPWTTVFQTEDRRAVEDYCRRAGIVVEWGGDPSRLRTRHVRPAVQRHPTTGETVWFNHATFFHVTTLHPTIRDVLLASFAEEDLPNNTYYGDGSPIEPAVLEHLREAYTKELVVFPWQRGDVMLLDNMLVAHGRSPYKGARRTLVAMARSISA